MVARNTLTRSAGTALVLGLVLAGGACSLSQDGVPPPADRIFFPGGALVDEQEGRWLYVVSSNSDLRYNAGTVVPVDLTKVCQDDRRNQEPRNQGRCPLPPGELPPVWEPCPYEPRYVPPATAEHKCCWDTLDRNILNCDEQDYILRARSVRLGSFGVQPVTQHFGRLEAMVDGNGNPTRSFVREPLPTGVDKRLFVPVRGNTSITMMDVTVSPDDVILSCTGLRPGPNPDQGEFALCDERWRLTRKDDPVVDENAVEVPEDQITRLPDEPYAAAVDEALQLLYVGHLRTGEITLFDLGDGMDNLTPELVHSAGGLLPPDANGARGVTSLKIRDPGECFGPVYVTSRYRALVSSFVVFGTNNPDAEFPCGPERPSPESARDIAIVGTGQVISTGIGGTETRGVEIAGGRAFVLQRSPPVLVAFDLATLAASSAIEVCQGPTALAVHEDVPGRPMLYVTCFDAGEVFVVDPTIPALRAVIPVGRGPVLTAFSATDPGRGYVVGFGGNNVLVLDLDPASPQYHRVIQRIGFPSATPREGRPQ